MLHWSDTCVQPVSFKTHPLTDSFKNEEIPSVLVRTSRDLFVNHGTFKRFRRRPKTHPLNWKVYLPLQIFFYVDSIGIEEENEEILQLLEEIGIEASESKSILKQATFYWEDKKGPNNSQKPSLKNLDQVLRYLMDANVPISSCMLLIVFWIQHS